jgi:hypothetical protein
MHLGVLVTEDLLVSFLTAHFKALIESYDKAEALNSTGWQLRRHMHKPSAV